MRIESAVLFWNPLGGKNLKEGLLLLALARHAHLSTEKIKNYPEIEKALRKHLAQGKRLFLISGGDGTISAFLTAYFRELKPPEIEIAVLPGGTNNLIAWDVARPFNQLKIFKAFLSHQRPRMLKRKALRIEPGKFFGMFCAAGLLAEGTFLYNELRKKEGVKGMKNILKVIAKLGKRGLRRELPLLVEPQSLVYAPETAMFTTLERLFIPLFPFPKVRNCREIKGGIFPQKLIPFKTFCTPKVRIHTPAIALDGEMIKSSDNVFELTTTKELTFLKW
ncbi:diacylglycerol kinase family protein [Thermodesulfatator atlanticus]|uniref:diacylglycerol kinase family protein n=1 Tax=Thermodesulfatator atlanticus TaxID=501497 RepID=UPI0003B32996|nr:diacylglycerol kinase family protein [Thermodesulfatator atlanticus]